MKKERDRIIRKAATVFNILNKYGMLSWMSDKSYLKLAYRMKLGKKLDLGNPQTFNEKLQWLKIYNRKSEFTKMVDKLEAKQFVAERIGVEHIIPTLGVWDSFEEIDFNTLPRKFVLKCTHDSGGLFVVREKSEFNQEIARERVEKSLKKNFYYNGREWPYKDVCPRIIVEQYMDDGDGTLGLKDYKFYCFNGEPKFLYLSQGLEDHATARISFVSLEWEREPFRRIDYKEFEELPSKPVCLGEMVRLARELSKGIPFLRVDFYEVNEKVYFGELTFYPGSGYTEFYPEEWNKRIGDMISLDMDLLG